MNVLMTLLFDPAPMVWGKQYSMLSPSKSPQRIHLEAADVKHTESSSEETSQLSDDDDEPSSVGSNSSSSEKSVRFADPIVTDCWSIPRKDVNDIEDLFYSSMDFAQFREENRGGGLKQYDKEHCEVLAEELDRIGAQYFEEGNFSKALNAFNHSLRVKTEAMEHFNHGSTAGTIHRIGDVYSKQARWALAKEAYAAALQVFEDGEPNEDDLDAQRIMSTLRQKVSILRRHLAIQKSERLVHHHVV